MKKIKELAEYLLNNILEDQEFLGVEIQEGEEFITLKIKVKEEAIGKVIGKGGRIINSLRNLLKIVSYKETGKGIAVDVVK